MTFTLHLGRRRDLVVSTGRHSCARPCGYIATRSTSLTLRALFVARRLTAVLITRAA